MYKVFGIGMFKTGTTSLGHALELLGFRAHYRFMPLLDDLTAYFDLDPEAFVPHTKQIRQVADDHDALADAPWLYLYRELDRWYPNSRFILTLREDSETLADSEQRHWQQHGLTKTWRARHEEPPTRAMFIERYRRHNAAVLAHFSACPERLLTICWETEPDPWQRLGRFVGRPVPDVPFPHLNRTPRPASSA